MLQRTRDGEATNAERESSSDWPNPEHDGQREAGVGPARDGDLPVVPVLRREALAVCKKGRGGAAEYCR